MSKGVVDIVIPVYNEGENILATLESLRSGITFSYKVLMCFDFDGDTTLKALQEHPEFTKDVILVKNQGSGALGAVVTGLNHSTGVAAIVLPADDDYNSSTINRMVSEFENGSDIVCASRFMPGGCMKGCPLIKAMLVRVSSFILYHFAGLPTRDATNGFRLFSKRVLSEIPIESRVGFAYSLELIAKVQRLGWKISEVPALWFERKKGSSRFRVISWIPQYMKWFMYVCVTRILQIRKPL